MAQKAPAREDELEQEERDDEPSDESEESEESDDGSESQGLFESLKSQVGERKSLLGPVASTAAAAAATYAAKKLPDLIEQIEDGGADKLLQKLDDASDAGGIKGFAAGTASRAFSGGGGNLVQRLVNGGKDEASEEVRNAPGATGALAKAAGKVTGSGSQGGYGWGRGRRLPILSSIDVAAPIATVYDQWTQFEELGSFMHRVEAVDQEEPETVIWHENIWGRKREWKVQITEQIPKERIAWQIKSGGQGTGVITFHELAPKLTRVELLFDWQPKGLVEKIGSGLRVHKRAAKTDLYRFKAFVETRGEATGGWHGRIEDGQVKRVVSNTRNAKADPVPREAKQHSEQDQESPSSDNSADKRSGSKDDSARGAAREERRRHREQRANQRKERA